MTFNIRSHEETVPQEVADSFYYLEDENRVYIVPTTFFDEDDDISLDEIRETRLLYASVLVINKRTQEVVKSRFF